MTSLQGHVYALMFKRPFLDRKIVPLRFVTLAGSWSRAHLTEYVFPTSHVVSAVGSRIFGTQTSLAANLTGAARMVVEAEKRIAKVVVNFIVSRLGCFVKGM